MRKNRRVTYLDKKSFHIRKNIIQMLVPTESHHIGCSLSIVDILTVLYFNELFINPKDPTNPNRDIFILSKGHAGAALYATLAERGFFDKNILKRYDVDGGVLPEHVTKIVPGIEVSTGSLGHGLPIGIGFAIAFKNENKKNKTFVLISDGELNEGSNWEAIMFSGQHKLNNLIAIVDLNSMQGYGMTKDIIDLEPLEEKFIQFNWNAIRINGHNFKELLNVFTKIKSMKDCKPTVVIAETAKGKGIPYFEGRFDSHYKSIDLDTKQKILSDLKRI